MTDVSRRRHARGSQPPVVRGAGTVRIIEGPDAGRSVPLSSDRIVVGRGPSCDLQLSDEAVAEQHAVIEDGDRGYWVRDLGTAGVMLAGNPVFAAPLMNGTTLRVGNTTLLIEEDRSGTVAFDGERMQVGPLISYSPKMRPIFRDIERIAATDMTVLISGETGTGKDVTARAIHTISSRASGPFIVFDCGAQSDGLIGAALFGHERGAFTGAVETRDGALSAAEGGTLMIDEIAELPLDLQPILLRVLESRESRRIGGSTLHRHDVRIIAATHRDLAEEVEAGRFRADLLYRLNVGLIRLPPLRERREDIPRLAEMFAAEVGATLSPQALGLLAAQDWPGNVRELRNMVSRAAVFPEDWLLESGELAPPPPLPQARRSAVRSFERAYLEKVLAMTGGNVTRAAEIAGVSRQLLTRLISRHRLREPRS